ACASSAPAARKWRAGGSRAARERAAAPLEAQLAGIESGASLGSSAEPPAAGWQLVEGDDDVPCRNWRVEGPHRTWEQMVAVCSTRPFTEPSGFPPGPRSVDGRPDDTGVGSTDFFRATVSEVSRTSPSPAEAGEEAPLCLCGQPARQRHVTRRHGSVESARAGGLEDLQQGGVGDCWFMSALAVVAERHDLITKLVPNLNAGMSTGCHEIRLFLDGRWTALLVDDHLPTTAKQRRPTADGSGLAFGRCARRQLWVSLVEKAYAKAHGAYSMISGGETAEALLDLTGAPTEVVHFWEPGFDPDLFWARLLTLLEAGCLVGCGTSSETLEELGLVGQHAYSVLEARDGSPAGGADGRAVRVRNPWGEWTRREQDELLAQLGAPVSPGDGCFWMRYADFLRGFACADICHAREGWHARSFDAEFTGAGAGSAAGSRDSLRVRAEHGTDCWFVAIQPTERGKQLRRPRGYHLNDLSLVLLDAETGESRGLVLGGARRDVSVPVFLEAGREYVLVPLSFRARRGPFPKKEKLYAAGPVRVLPEPLPSAAPVWAALRSLAMQPALPPRTQRLVYRLGHGVAGLGGLVLEGPAMAIGIAINEHPDAAMLVSLAGAANHAVVCGPMGQEEGVECSERNRKSGDQPSRGQLRRRRGPREPRPSWREHALQAVVPPASMQLLFAAVALVEQHWEFALEGVEAQQLPGEACGADAAAGREHAFGAAPVPPGAAGAPESWPRRGSWALSHVKALALAPGRSLAYEMSCGRLVEALRLKISEECGLEASELVMGTRSEIMRDGRILARCGPDEGVCITVTRRVRGGADEPEDAFMPADAA
ncbi:unnamed protein product, partial [Prorocentrum cordatum]